jgi:hypothetical protein
VRAAFTLLTALAVLSLAACGEREQVGEVKRGKYQGKPDTQPWSNAPLAYENGKWTQGDRASWETQIRTRQSWQNERTRAAQ